MGKSIKKKSGNKSVRKEPTMIDRLRSWLYRGINTGRADLKRDSAVLALYSKDFRKDARDFFVRMESGNYGTGVENIPQLAYLINDNADREGDAFYENFRKTLERFAVYGIIKKEFVQPKTPKRERKTYFGINRQGKRVKGNLTVFRTKDNKIRFALRDSKGRFLKQSTSLKERIRKGKI